MLTKETFTFLVNINQDSRKDSIEAARAGDAGRGFAVVAEEIGKLASDSKALADEIKNEMAGLLATSENAVKASDEVRGGNEEQMKALGETLTEVNKMLDDINETMTGIGKITDGAEVCVGASGLVNDSMQSLSAISQENAAASEETGASMEELSATVATLASSAGNLKHIAETLNEEMKFFKE